MSPNRRAQNWFVYISKGRTNRYYTGISTIPEKRIKEHNQGFGAKFAQDQGPLNLVYKSSPFQTKSSARKREIQIKGWIRAKKEKLISGEYT